jgi:hypothetical protein
VRGGHPVQPTNHLLTLAFQEWQAWNIWDVITTQKMFCQAFSKSNDGSRGRQSPCFRNARAISFLICITWTPFLNSFRRRSGICKILFGIMPFYLLPSEAVHYWSKILAFVRLLPVLKYKIIDTSI